MMGSYSGIDKATIDQLMAAEKMPLVQLANKKTSITEQQNAWKDVNTRLNSLFEKIKALQSKNTFDAKISSSTNDKNVSMTAGNSAIAGTYKIRVTQLATNSRIIGKKIENLPVNETTGKVDITKPIKIEGSFIIKNHDFDNVLFTEEDKAALTVKIETTDSLKDITDKINSTTKASGISASIINNQLVITDSKTGARKLELENVKGDTLSLLSLDTVPSVDTKGVQAIFSVNGVDDIKSDSNTVTGVIESATINLSKVHTGTEYDTVTIAQDNSVLPKAVQEFVDQYNSTMTFIEDKLKAGDPKVAGSKGALAGDGSLMRLHSSLRNLVTSVSPNSSTDIKDISKLGITTIDKFGQLQFDSSKLTKALSEDPENVMKFFTSKDGDKEIGFAPRLREYVDIFVSKSNGIIKGKSDSFDKMLKGLTTQIDTFSARMVKKEAYYIKKFTALDVALMNAESQMSWLQGQVDSMNGIKK